MYLFHPFELHTLWISSKGKHMKWEVRQPLHSLAPHHRCEQVFLANAPIFIFRTAGGRRLWANKADQHCISKPSVGKFSCVLVQTWPGLNKVCYFPMFHLQILRIEDHEFRSVRGKDSGDLQATCRDSLLLLATLQSPPRSSWALRAQSWKRS